MKKTKIIGILIRDRIKEAGKLQILLSSHNEIIRSRLGFHELSQEVCSRVGIIILTLDGNPDEWKPFEKELSAIEGIEFKEMLFNY
ncbi:MAG: hypothetical protein WBH71_03000 [Bacteroidales bacterium]|jgi:hypothetical protein|nr:hypothetical protein [Bacteroidales bacterium]MDI9591531.1 hypothetical protein [Bacteroidota bacterium]NLH33877.1 hypothetical protein [Lentimicrobium sp.]OQC38623.1 MAG: hypothetical protein BWX63_00005 [Bacteroidetes bacterium ADurb.Bin041]MBP7875065.1 hypothetical protein [Bacteroidales bacterium]